MAQLVVLWLLAGCASRGDRHWQARETGGPHPAATESAPVAFERAQPLDLEPGSYAASQRDHYNRIYARPDSERPPANAFLPHCLDLIDAQRTREQAERAAPSDAIAVRAALDIAMGDGRNTIALAQRGYRTVGFDMSDVGVNRARQRAAELGLTIDARVDLLDAAGLEADRWDVVVLMYFGVGDAALKQIKESIRPGGYVIMEFSGGGAVTNKTLHDFMDWQILVYENTTGDVQWKRKQPATGPGPRVRLLARRPLRS